MRRKKIVPLPIKKDKKGYYIQLGKKKVRVSVSTAKKMVLGQLSKGKIIEPKKTKKILGRVFHKANPSSAVWASRNDKRAKLLTEDYNRRLLAQQEAFAREREATKFELETLKRKAETPLEKMIADNAIATSQLGELRIIEALADSYIENWKERNPDKEVPYERNALIRTLQRGTDKDRLKMTKSLLLNQPEERKVPAEVVKEYYRSPAQEKSLPPTPMREMTPSLKSEPSTPKRSGPANTTPPSRTLQSPLRPQPIITTPQSNPVRRSIYKDDLESFTEQVPKPPQATPEALTQTGSIDLTGQIGSLLERSAPYAEVKVPEVKVEPPTISAEGQNIDNFLRGRIDDFGKPDKRFPDTETQIRQFKIDLDSNIRKIPIKDLRIILGKPNADRDTARQEGKKYYQNLASSKLDQLAQQGKGKTENGEGLTSDQIETILQNDPSFNGTCLLEEFPNVISKFKPDTIGSCIILINYNPKTKTDGHWVALRVDPIKDMSLEYYDPLADDIPRELQDMLPELVEKIKPDTYLKLKTNNIKHQSEKSDNCGWFASRFLIDRRRGKGFPEASGYTDVHRNEHEIQNFKDKFSYISGKGITGFVGSGILDPLDWLIKSDYSPSVKSWLKQNEEKYIVGISVARKPIFSTIQKLLNLLSLGKIGGNMSRLNYDKLFHLYLVLRLTDGTYKVEKNEKITISPFRGYEPDSEHLDVNFPHGVKVKDFFQNAQRYHQSLGLDFFKYSGFPLLGKPANNCQTFVMSLLRGNNVSQNNIQSFVQQDMKEVIRGSPKYLAWFSKNITDLAGLLSQLRGSGPAIEDENNRDERLLEQNRQLLNRLNWSLAIARQARQQNPELIERLRARILEVQDEIARLEQLLNPQPPREGRGIFSQTGGPLRTIPENPKRSVVKFLE